MHLDESSPMFPMLKCSHDPEIWSQNSNRMTFNRFSTGFWPRCGHILFDLKFENRFEILSSIRICPSSCSALFLPPGRRIPICSLLSGCLEPFQPCSVRSLPTTRRPWCHDSFFVRRLNMGVPIQRSIAYPECSYARYASVSDPLSDPPAVNMPSPSASSWASSQKALSKMRQATRIPVYGQ